MTFIQQTTAKGQDPQGNIKTLPVSGQVFFTDQILEKDGTVTTDWFSTNEFSSIKYNIQSDQPGTLQIEYSQDGEGVNFTPSARIYDTNPRLFQAGLDPKLNFARFTYTNTGNRQGNFTLEVRMSPNLIQPTVSSLNSELLPTNLGQVSASVLFNPNEDGSFTPAGLNLLANADNQTNGEQKTQIVNESPLDVRIVNPMESEGVDVSGLAQDSTLTDGTQITKIADDTPIKVQLPLETTVNLSNTEPLNIQGKVNVQGEDDPALRVTLDTPIQVSAPEVNVAAPVVNVPPAQITVQPSSVDFPDTLKVDDSTPVRVEITNQQDPVINVEAPVVNVPAPEITVNPTPITVEAPIVNVDIPDTVTVSNFPASQNVTLVNGNNQTVGNQDRPLTVNANVAFPTNQTISGNVNATIQGTPTVNATVTFPTSQAITANALPLPAGAATSVLQTTGNASLANIDTDLGSISDAAVTNPANNGSVIAVLKGILGSQIGYSTVATQTTVNASTAGVQALAANANRKNAFITNTTSVSVSIYYGTSTTARVATLTSIGSYWEMNPDLYRGAITVKSASGTPLLEIVETT